jgi:hypothetical protein
MTRLPLKLVAAVLAVTVALPMASAGTSEDVYDFGILWPLSIAGVDIDYGTSGVPAMVCLELTELGDEGPDEASRTLCQPPKSVKTRIVNEDTTIVAPPKPLPVGVDDAFLFFVYFSDLVPQNPSYSPSPVSTAINCVVIFQEGGERVGIWQGDDFVIFSNCPSAADPWTDV